MTQAFQSIKQGLNEAISHARGNTRGVMVCQPQAVDVFSLRTRLGLTQEQFAARVGVSVATLRHWERGDRSPKGAALVLLNVINKDPRAVMRALS